MIEVFDRWPREAGLVDAQRHESVQSGPDEDAEFVDVVRPRPAAGDGGDQALGQGIPEKLDQWQVDPPGVSGFEHCPVVPWLLQAEAAVGQAPLAEPQSDLRLMTLSPVGHSGLEPRSSAWRRSLG